MTGPEGDDRVLRVRRASWRSTLACAVVRSSDSPRRISVSIPARSGSARQCSGLMVGCKITEVKTERSRRLIAMPDGVVRALKARHVRQLEERLAAGQLWQSSGLVFTNPADGPLEPITLHRNFKRVLSKAGIPTATRFHDLRYSAASLLLAQGVHLRVIMELLGHSSISLTTNTYGHVMPAAMREVADKMESILGV
jgi:integrase